MFSNRVNEAQRRIEADERQIDPIYCAQCDGYDWRSRRNELVYSEPRGHPQVWLFRVDGKTLPYEYEKT